MAVPGGRIKRTDADRLGRRHQEILIHIPRRQPSHPVNDRHGGLLLRLAHVRLGRARPTRACLQPGRLLGDRWFCNLQLRGHRYCNACAG